MARPWWLLALTLTACPLRDPVPVEPVPPNWYPPAGWPVVVEVDGSAVAERSPCGRACASLRRLDCPEGQPSRGGVSCYRTCLRMASLERIPAECWASAVTVDAVRACGLVRCVP